MTGFVNVWDKWGNNREWLNFISSCRGYWYDAFLEEDYPVMSRNYFL